jgi:hypothetical protein
MCRSGGKAYTFVSCFVRPGMRRAVPWTDRIERLMWAGYYARKQARSWEERLALGMVFVDVGAYLGYFAAPGRRPSEEKDEYPHSRRIRTVFFASAATRLGCQACVVIRLRSRICVVRRTSFGARGWRGERQAILPRLSRRGRTSWQPGSQRDERVHSFLAVPTERARVIRDLRRRGVQLMLIRESAECSPSLPC